LLGHLIYVDRNQTSKPARVVRSHNKSIESMAIDRATGKVYSGSYDAIMYAWDVSTGESTPFSGAGHTNAIKRMVVQGKDLITCGLDDTVHITPLSTLAYNSGIKLDSVPSGVGAGDGFIAAASVESVFIIRNGAIASTLSVAYRPQAVAASGSFVAVGGENNNVYLYKVSGNTMTEEAVLKGHRGPITRLDFSPDGKWLATADKNREVMVFDVAKKELKQKDWVFHSARIDGLSFSPNSDYVASAGLDQTIIIWSLANPSSRVTIKGAHQGGITEILWLNDTTVLTSGQDCTIRSYTVL